MNIIDCVLKKINIILNLNLINKYLKVIALTISWTWIYAASESNVMFGKEEKYWEKNKNKNIRNRIKIIWWKNKNFFIIISFYFTYYLFKYILTMHLTFTVFLYLFKDKP